MKRFTVFLLVLFLYSSIITYCIAPIELSQAFKRSDNTWQQFREKFKFHYQTLAVEHIQSDDSYVIVISEPPNQFSLIDLKDFFKNYNSSIKVKEHKIGYDGWLKDAVVAINGINSNDLDELIGNLSKFLFHSDYKAYYIKLPVTRNIFPYLQTEVNYQITPAELQNWLLNEHETFYELKNKAHSSPLKALFKENRTGIFYNKDTGLVLWLLKVSSDISSQIQKENIRRFALDADMILGSVSDGKLLAIVGRERKNDVYELAPLEVETLLLLADANKEELAQSYERNHLVAGKQAGGKDWAPIYLSQELQNTEFGSLLNITDQLLKSWSMNGIINYEKFNYLMPDHWAFSNGVDNYLKVSGLVFNWNTKGAVYSLKSDNYDFVAINQSGSLPVSYFPDGSKEDVKDDLVKLSQEKAYNFFSGLNNPDLIRVVQYSALYQIFTKYKIKAKEYKTHNSIENFDFFTKHIKDFFVKIRDLSKKDKIELTKRLSKESFETFKAYFKAENEKSLKETAEILNISIDSLKMRYPSKPKPENDSINSIILEELANDYKLKIDSAQLIVKILFEQLTLVEQRAFFQKLSNPQKSVNLSNLEEMHIYFWIRDFNRNTDKFKLFKSDYSSFFGKSIEGLKEDYINFNSSNKANWIKTPSIVQSWSSNDSAFVIGGHNIDSRLTPIIVDNSVQKGKFTPVELSGRRFIKVNKADLGRVTPRLINEIASARKISKLPKSFSGPLMPLRQRIKVIPADHVSGIRGLDKVKHIEVVKKDYGYSLNGKVILKASDLNKELIGSLKGSQGKVAVTFQNFSETEVSANISSAELKFTKDAILKRGDNKFIDSRTFDFEKAIRENLADGKIKITLPSLPTANPSKASFTIKNFTQHLEESIQNLFNRIKNKEIFDGNSIIEELKKANVKSEDIEATIDNDLRGDVYNPESTNGYC
ncbi:MAG: hypothetical protein NT007_16110 [Candidatus Kapabacteria bacterium]|nr:hypothetical protein [Candidatus Kapabacteria bacterium]